VREFKRRQIAVETVAAGEGFEGLWIWSAPSDKATTDHTDFTDGIERLQRSEQATTFSSFRCFIRVIREIGGCTPALFRGYFFSNMRMQDVKSSRSVRLYPK
jgi:hypothetical protein